MELFIFLVILIVPICYFVIVYNKIISIEQDCINADKQIDIQLDRRFKVFDNLIKAVNKVMDYEKTTLKDVVELRNKAKKAEANNQKDKKIEAENEISRIASNIDVVFENYPELQAVDNLGHFQETIVETENKLSFSKQYYNDSVERLNSYKNSFPPNIIVKMFSRLDVSFEYWGITEEKRDTLENYQVNFDK